MKKKTMSSESACAQRFASELVQHIFRNANDTGSEYFPKILELLQNIPLMNKELTILQRLIKRQMCTPGNTLAKRSDSLFKNEISIAPSESCGSVKVLQICQLDTKMSYLFLQLVPSDAVWLFPATLDASWSPFIEIWDEIPTDLKWISMQTGDKLWIAYRASWTSLPEDLRWVAVQQRNPVWLHLARVWQSVPLDEKVRAIACKNPLIALPTTAEMWFNNYAANCADIADSKFEECDGPHSLPFPSSSTRFNQPNC